MQKKCREFQSCSYDLCKGMYKKHIQFKTVKKKELRLISSCLTLASPIALIVPMRKPLLHTLSPF